MRYRVLIMGLILGAFAACDACDSCSEDCAEYCYERCGATSVFVEEQATVDCVRACGDAECGEMIYIFLIPSEPDASQPPSCEDRCRTECMGSEECFDVCFERDCID